MMTDRNGNRIPPMTKEQVDEFLRVQGVTVKNNKGYDVPYVFQMKKSDCWGSSIVSDKQLAFAVMDYMDDPDGSKTKAFDHFVVDCRSKGEPVFWSEMM